jgi:hypothetical protein
VTGVQTCALPISERGSGGAMTGSYEGGASLAGLA